MFRSFLHVSRSFTNLGASVPQEEVELRAASIQAVEKLQAVLASKGRACLSIELDWLLWQRGEKMKDGLLPHHRTLTVYY